MLNLTELPPTAYNINDLSNASDKRLKATLVSHKTVTEFNRFLSNNDALSHQFWRLRRRDRQMAREERKKEFGRLVKALREEYRDMTQQDLANRIGRGFTKNQISNIETGRKVSLLEDELLGMADALELTSQERREFFIASLRLDTKSVCPDANASTKILAELTNWMRKLFLPAFISDTYGDFLAVNNAVFFLCGMENRTSIRKEIEEAKGKFNYLRILFDSKFGIQRKMSKSQWEETAYRNILHFRTVTFQHRTTEYFKWLLDELRQIDEFEKYWRWIRFYEKDYYHCGGGYMSFDKYPGGSLNYIIANKVAITHHGPIELHIYVPASSYTLDVTNKIVERVGTDVYTQMTPWPDKKIPYES